MQAMHKGPGIPFDLAGLMRRHKVTIRELSRRMGVTLKAIRAVRARDRVAYLTYCDYHEAVTGARVFRREVYEATGR